MYAYLNRRKLTWRNITPHSTWGGGTKTELEFDLQRFAVYEKLYIDNIDGDYLVYSAIPVVGELILIGREFVEGEFTFDFYDDNGEIINITNNDANGYINFKPVAAIKAGVYTPEEVLAKFKISGESNLGDGLIYDGNEFEFEVKLDSNGNISDENTYLLIRFTVEYKEPEVPVQPN